MALGGNDVEPPLSTDGVDCAPFLLLFRSGMTLRVDLSLDCTGEDVVREACKGCGCTLPDTQVLCVPEAVAVGRHESLRSKNIAAGSILYLNPRFF